MPPKRSSIQALEHAASVHLTKGDRARFVCSPFASRLDPSTVRHVTPAADVESTAEWRFGAHIWDSLTAVGYEVIPVIVAGVPMVAYVSVRSGPRMQEIDWAELVPTRTLARLAQRYLEADAVIVSMDEEALVESTSKRASKKPSPVIFAMYVEVVKLYRSDYRSALADVFGVGAYTIDDWLREARAQGLLPPGTRGRPRKITTDPEGSTK